MSESISDITIMLDDTELVKVVASWPKMTDAERKEEFDIAVIAGVPQRNVKTLVRRAKAHGLVYDDGTINSFAEKYLQTLVGIKLKKRQGIK